jgi:ParB-like chromosome segregation protein Spo0J
MDTNTIISRLQEFSWEEKIQKINELQKLLSQENPIQHPVGNVQRIPQDKVIANDYNPNKVAPPEMKLLYHSIKMDWYTQPIVAYYDNEKDKYVIVDGFHRHRVGKEYKDISESIMWHLPIVVIDKEIKDRMSSTIRHNRARWKHSVDWMSEIVADLIKKWWDDDQIMIELWMERDEVLRLKQNTGLGEIFKDRNFSTAWDV